MTSLTKYNTSRVSPNSQLQSPEIRLLLGADIILPHHHLDPLDVLPLDTVGSCDHPGAGDERSSTVECSVPTASLSFLVRSGLLDFPGEPNHPRVLVFVRDCHPSNNPCLPLDPALTLSLIFSFKNRKFNSGN